MKPFACSRVGNENCLRVEGGMNILTIMQHFDAPALPWHNC